jgi:hypothetical protein
VNIERGIIIAAVIIVIGAAFNGKVWDALTALGTLGAVGAALYLGRYREHLKRPILEIDFYEKRPPHLRQVPPFRNGVKQTGSLYPISIRLTNVGKTIAKNAQVVINSMWTYQNDKWIIHPNWIPVVVQWALDEMNPHPSETKDLVPYRSYVFNLGVINSLEPNIIELKILISPGNQLTWYEPGKYCFEVMVCAEGIGEPLKRYFYTTWSGGCSVDMAETEKTIIVEMKNSPSM